jgi:hypothetical protein
MFASNSSRLSHPWLTFLAVIVCFLALAVSPELAQAQFTQQGPKLVGTGAVGNAGQASVAVSADGNTAIVGGPEDNVDSNTGSPQGAAWVYTRANGVWTQQGSKLVGTGAVGSSQGSSVALSGDGNTAIVGGNSDNSGVGAVWVYTRSGGAWTQQGSKLVGTGAVGQAQQGSSVALSADGSTAIVGGPVDNIDSNTGSSQGAAWVYTRSGGVWTQQGPKLVANDAVGNAEQGVSVALSADGNTAIVGGPLDNSDPLRANGGAAWVFTRTNGVWTQQGSKLVGTGASGGNAQGAGQGSSVSLSADGNTAIVGGPGDVTFAKGATWVFTRSNGFWAQQGAKLVGTGAVGISLQGSSVALSGDGNTAIVGGPADNNDIGATWVFTRSGGVWTQQGAKLVGNDAFGQALQGSSVSLSADGNTAIVGGFGDNSMAGAAWVFVRPGLQVTPTNDIVAVGNQGGPFVPSSFQYQLSASAGNINYSISGVPNWLTPSATAGNVSSFGTAVTFTVNANANTLAPGTYGPTTITFTNSDTGQGTQTRTATLTVNPPALQVTPATNISASGPQGGPFSPSSFSYILSVASGSVNYSITNVPPWLTPSSTSGTASSSGTTVTFTVNANANSLTPNNYVSSINFNNTTNGQGNTTRVATLTVNPPPVLQVTPATNMVASGTQGGPFSPPLFSYTLSTSSGSINFAISGFPSWLTPSAISGTASTNGTIVTFTVNASANSLAANTYLATITFTNSDTGQGTQNRTATLTVNPPSSALQVTPTSNIVVTGNQGALAPSSFPYALSATAGTVNYSISGIPNWLTPSSTSGNVSSSGTTVTFTVNANANSLAPGTYGPTTITFTNSSTGQGTQTRAATLTVNPPALQVTPGTDSTASGAHGGPFSPSSFKYTLSSTFGSVKYSITTPSWLTASSTSGTLTTSAKTITFTVNSKARGFGPGTYTDNIGFNNTTKNQGNTTRIATLIVNPKQYKLTVSASPASYGTVSGGGTFTEGSSHTVTATPNGSHSFVNWTQNGKVVSTSASYTLAMPSANTTLTAHFK